MKSTRALTLIVLFSILTLAPCASAQVLYGSLTGTVSDQSGAAVPGGKVLATNTATGVEKQATTDDRGVYLISDLQPGIYDVSISAPAFSSVVNRGVRVDANTVRRTDSVLNVSQVSESVTVDASAATLQTDKADVNSQLATSQVSNLPLTGSRNFQNLFKIVPGFSPPAASHSEAGNPQGALATNVNGASYNNNATRLDGALDTYPWLPEIVAYVPPAESIETVNVVTASFDAEQGMAGGSVVNVQIKNGTNQVHGTLWEYNALSNLKARNYFYYGANNPKNILNQFGGNVGGPIKKNKLFFFADWERTLRRQSVNSFQSIATSAMRSGNFAGTGATIYDPSTGNADGTGRTPFANGVIPTNRINSAAAQMVALLPAPNLTTANNTPQSNYFASGSYAFTRDNIDAKVSYNATDRLAIFGRYSISPTSIFDPQALGGAGGPATDGGQPGNAPGRVQSAGFGGTYTITPSLLVDGNVGYTRLRLGAQNVDIDKNYGLDVLKIPGTNGPDKLDGGYPAFNFNGSTSGGNQISGLTNLGNQNNSNPFLFRDNEYVATVNVGWTKGAHSLRFGAEYQRFGINHFQPQTSYGPRGGFTFTGGLTSLNGGPATNLFYNAWADFLLGLPQQLGTAVQNINPSAVRESSYAFYARDQWQVSRKLTLSYGMRYEYYPFATRDHFGGDRFDPLTNIVYLGGLGGVPNDTGVDVGKGQIAPRVGVAYRLNEKTVIRAGFGISVDPNNFRAMRDAYPAIIALSITGPTSYQAAGSLVTGIPAVPRPDITGGTLLLPNNIATTTFKQDFNRGYIESYNLTLQRDIWAGFNLQAAYVGTRAIRHSDQVNVNAAGPGGGNAGRVLFPITGRTTDVTEIMPFNDASYNALQTQLKRRLGSSGTFGATYTFSKAINYGDNDDSGLTWAWVPMYARNKALAGFDRTHNFQAYTNWELPFGRGKKWATQGLGAAVIGGWQLNALLSRTSGTPFNVASSGTSVNAPGNTQTADQVLSSVAILGGHGPGNPYFDPNAFAAVTSVRFGTSGRDIIRGPGLFNTDLSLFRDFSVTERFKLQFRAEAFNFTNTPQFGNPGATVTSATRNADGSIKAYNGYTEITTASNERQLRFALRLSF
jgi:hypothetical protein